MQIKNLLILLILACTVPSVFGQARINTFDDIQKRDQLAIPQEYKKAAVSGEVTPLYTDETADVGPQYILKPKLRRLYFETLVDTQYYYNNNVFMQENRPAGAPVDSGIFVVTAQFAVAPTPGWEIGDGMLSPRLGFRNQSYFYSADNLDNLNFTGQTVFADLNYQFAKSWQARSGIDATRLFSNQENQFEFYKELLPRWGLDKIFEITPVSAFIISYDGNYHATESNTQIPGLNLPLNLNDRTDQMLTLSYVHQLVPNLTVRPYYQFKYTKYTNKDLTGFGRTDYLNTVGLIANYSFNNWASVRLFCSYAMNQSDNPIIPDYNQFNGGIGATVVFRF